MSWNNFNDAEDQYDVIITNAPAELGLSFPMIWECKSLNSKSWNETASKGLAKTKPIYAAQVATYQAYMEGSIEGICRNPALFTAINKDTAELYHELSRGDILYENYIVFLCFPTISLLIPICFDRGKIFPKIQCA